MDEKPYLSVVVPLYNEEGNVVELHRRIVESLRKIRRPDPIHNSYADSVISSHDQSFEVIFVDDGSKDKTLEMCQGLSPLKLVVFRKNFGQTAAFDAGIKVATGEIIITIDGDLQNDPDDIPLLLTKIDEGYDVVSGWRFKRRDNFMKRFFSRGANMLRSILIKDHIHDSGCSLKAYRRECFQDIDLFGEMHRFIPAILQLEGFRVGEVKVSHYPRLHGVTKYNWKRAVKGFVDMVAIWFWRNYSYRPLHLFGGAGVTLSIVGSGILLWMLVEKVVFHASIGDRLWPLVGIFCVLMGVQLFVAGLLADILVRNYYQIHKRMNYTIRETRVQ